MDALLSTSEISAGFWALFPRNPAKKDSWGKTAGQGCCFAPDIWLPKQPWEPRYLARSHLVWALGRCVAQQCGYPVDVLLQFFAHPLFVFRNWEASRACITEVVDFQHSSKVIIHTQYHQKSSGHTTSAQLLLYLVNVFKRRVAFDRSSWQWIYGFQKSPFLSSHV